MQLPVVVLALAVALAGCTAEPPAPPPPEPSQPVTPTAPAPEPAAPAPAGPQVLVFNGTVGGAGVPGGPKVAPGALGENGFDFELPNGSAGLVVELVWSGPDVLELQAYIPAEHCAPASDPLGATAQCDNPEGVEGASPLKVLVADPEHLAYAGAWAAAAFPTGAMPGTAFTMFVSIFEGAAPAESYSAIAG